MGNCRFLAVVHLSTAQAYILTPSLAVTGVLEHNRYVTVVYRGGRLVVQGLVRPAVVVKVK